MKKILELAHSITRNAVIFGFNYYNWNISWLKARHCACKMGRAVFVIFGSLYSWLDALFSRCRILRSGLFFKMS